MFFGYTDAFSRWLLLQDHTTLYQGILLEFLDSLQNNPDEFGFYFCIFIKNHPTNHHIFCQKNLPTISQTPMPFGPQISKGTISFGIFCGSKRFGASQKKGTEN